MKETLYSRNAVYEILRARRRQAFSLEIAEGAQEKGRLSEILQLSNASRAGGSTASTPTTRAWRWRPAAIPTPT
jgi:hypothetical protein